jgi:hypothetical protein
MLNMSSLASRSLHAWDDGNEKTLQMRNVIAACAQPPIDRARYNFWLLVECVWQVLSVSLVVAGLGVRNRSIERSFALGFSLLHMQVFRRANIAGKIKNNICQQKTWSGCMFFFIRYKVLV